MKRTESWFRVALEGLLIVGSILLAFGIEAAWAERQERATEAEYLDAILAEAVDNIALAEGTLAVADQAMDALVRAERILAAGAAGDSANVLLQSLLQGVVWAGAPGQSTAVLDDLIGTNGLGVIRSDQVRRSILDYRSGIDALFLRAEYFGQSVAPGLNSLISRSVETGYSGLEGATITTAPWSPEGLRSMAEGLASDPDLRGEIRAEFRRIELQRNFIDQMIARHRGMPEALQGAG